MIRGVPWRSSTGTSQVRWLTGWLAGWLAGAAETLPGIPWGSHTPERPLQRCAWSASARSGTAEPGSVGSARSHPMAYLPCPAMCCLPACLQGLARKCSPMLASMPSTLAAAPPRRRSSCRRRCRRRTLTSRRPMSLPWPACATICRSSPPAQVRCGWVIHSAALGVARDQLMALACVPLLAALTGLSIWPLPPVQATSW